MVSDKELNLDYKANNKQEKIIKITLLDEKENKDRLCLSIISVDITKVKTPNSKITYQEFMQKLKDENVILQS